MPQNDKLYKPLDESKPAKIDFTCIGLGKIQMQFKML
jgi:hypothetical protein